MQNHRHSLTGKKPCIPIVQMRTAALIAEIALLYLYTCIKLHALRCSDFAVIGAAEILRRFRGYLWTGL